MRKITYCLIDDTALPLLFSLGAEMEISEKIGSIEKVLDMFKGEETESEKTIRLELEKGMTPEQLAARDAENAESLNLLDVLPLCLAIMARQGQMYLGEQPSFTPEWIKIHSVPNDVEQMAVAMCKAISDGLGTRHNVSDDSRDLVAEALEKN